MYSSGRSLAIITSSARILYVFTPRELEILGELVLCATQDDDYVDDWDPDDREIMDQLKLKLDPEAQAEILELEGRFRQVATEGDGNGK